MPKPWVCKGVAKDQQSHDNQSPAGPHDPYENFGDDCVICNLTREQVIGDDSGGGVPVKPIALGAAALLFLGGGGWFALKPCPDDQVKASFGIGCMTPPPPPKPPNNGNKEGETNGAQTDQDNSDQTDESDTIRANQDNGDQTDENIVPGDRYSWEPARFAWGQQTLFSGIGNQLRDQGIDAFRQEDYAKASQLFKRAVEGKRNDPEPLIFYNNAKAHAKGNPLTLAVVVPVDKKEKSAQEMLRGVAQAQDEINSNGGIDGRFVEIVIANDGNDPKAAAKVAQALSDDPTVLGVIGHNSSNASEAGLSVYETAGLPMISPTSTSTSLKGDVFFRTVPSDAAAAEKLATHVSESLNITKAAIFYNPDSSFSSSLKEAFETRFTSLGGEVIPQDMTDSDFSPGTQVSTSILKDETEAILLFPNTDYTSVAIEIARANKGLEEDRVPLLGGDSLYSIDTLVDGGESVDGLVVAIPWFAAAPESADFTKAGEKRWNGTVNWRTAMSYDATQVFLAALTEDASRQSVLANLKTVTLGEDDTSGQAFQFTSDGERQSEPLLVEIRRGENNPPGSEFGYNLLE